MSRKTHTYTIVLSHPDDVVYLEGKLLKNLLPQIYRDSVMHHLANSVFTDPHNNFTKNKLL